RGERTPRPFRGPRLARRGGRGRVVRPALVPGNPDGPVHRTQGRGGAGRPPQWRRRPGGRLLPWAYRDLRSVPAQPHRALQLRRTLARPDLLETSKSEHSSGEPAGSEARPRRRRMVKEGPSKALRFKP